MSYILCLLAGRTVNRWRRRGGFFWSFSMLLNSTIFNVIFVILLQFLKLKNIFFKIQLLSYSVTQLFSYSVIQLLSYSVTQLFSYSVTQLFSYSVTQLFSYSVFSYSVIQLFSYSVTQLFS